MLLAYALQARWRQTHSATNLLDVPLDQMRVDVKASKMGDLSFECSTGIIRAEIRCFGICKSENQQLQLCLLILAFRQTSKL